MDVTVRELRLGELGAAAGVLARSMRDNPMHLRSLCVDPEERRRRLEGMFRGFIPRMMRKGVLLGAFRDGVLVGVVGMMPPGGCQPTLGEMVAMIPQVLMAIGPGSLMRMGEWRGEWRKRDLREPHWHLGPVAVDAQLQGQGVGSAMMMACCARLDLEGTVGYLETDKLVNVRFYERFGFQTVAEAPVLGTLNWFMRRHSRR